MYAAGLVLCGEFKKDMRAMVGHFVEVCKRRSLKVNAGKSKVMVLSEEEGMECEVCIDGVSLEQRIPIVLFYCIPLAFFIPVHP